MDNVTSPELPLDHSTTANIFETPTNNQWPAYVLFTASKYMKYICPPVLFLLGSFGNVMTIIIMRRMFMEAATNNIYFIALAASDVVCLTNATIPLWLSHLLGYDVTGAHDLLCKGSMFLLYLASCSSCWFLVCLTVQRAMSVVWPHRVNLMCTRRTVVGIVAAIPTLLSVFFSRYIFFRERVVNRNSTVYYCTMTEYYVSSIQLIFSQIEPVLYTFVPYILIALSNVVLVWKLTMSLKKTGRRLTHGDSEQVEAREKAASSVTLTLIVLSMSFLALTLPNAVFYMVAPLTTLYVVEGTQPGYEVARLTLISEVCYLCSTTNCALNFYLYCLTGRKFREEFIKVMHCGRNRQGSGAPSGIGHVTSLSQPGAQLRPSVNTDAVTKRGKT
ncbi:hypothetical protein ACOMHN_007329 [Nucella lapillus]